MLAANRTVLFPALLVDELVRAGVRHAVVSPGSRSTPLALALVRHGSLKAWSHIDERAGSFFALGLARRTRTPVVVACTSGTAAANLLPAVVEAWHAQVPLILLTADRPPELRDCGAGQTIDQIRLFGTHVRWFVEVGTPEASADALRYARTLACRAAATAAGPPAGPVHLNCPFREPLVPEVVPGDVPPDLALKAPLAARGRDGGPYTRVGAGTLVPDAAAVAEVVAALAHARRPLVVCGPLDDPDPELPAAVAALAAALGAPVLADATANLRRPALAACLADVPDALVRAPRFAAAHVPDAVVRLGAPPTSRALATWLARHDTVPQVVIDATGGWPEPAGVASHVLRARPTAACAALAAALGGPRAPGDWTARWQRAGAAARAALEGALAREEAPFEPHAVAALAATLPATATLYVGNSMAVRALDAFWPADGPPVRVLANRGANGIDGFVSSVLGAAAGAPAPVLGLCGDLSFLHDLHGLLTVRRHGVRATFLVLDNDGGGIFDFLPVARVGEGYEEFFATPHGLDFRPAVEMYGAAFVRVRDAAALPPALAAALAAPVTTVVELAFARAHSVAGHARLWEAAAAALGERS